MLAPRLALNSGSEVGRGFAFVGDVTGDGVEDLAVGGPTSA